MGSEVHNTMKLLHTNDRKRLSKQIGFSVIELITSMAVIGLLAGIGMTSYHSAQRSTNDVAAANVVRTIGLAEEIYFEQFENFTGCNETNCHIVLEGVRKAPRGVILNVRVDELSGALNISATHERGTGKTFSWKSSGYAKEGGVAN